MNSIIPAARALEIFQALSSADAYRTLTSHLLKHETREPALFLPIFGARIPVWLRRFSSWILSKFLDEKTFARIVSASGEKKTAIVWNWQNERDEYGRKVKEYLWKELGLDTVICRWSMRLIDWLIFDPDTPPCYRSGTSISRRLAWGDQAPLAAGSSDYLLECGRFHSGSHTRHTRGCRTG